MDVSWSGVVQHEYYLGPPTAPGAPAALPQQGGSEGGAEGETGPPLILLQACYSDVCHLLAAGAFDLDLPSHHPQRHQPTESARSGPLIANPPHTNTYKQHHTGSSALGRARRGKQRALLELLRAGHPAPARRAAGAGARGPGHRRDGPCVLLVCIVCGVGTSRS